MKDLLLRTVSGASSTFEGRIQVPIGRPEAVVMNRYSNRVGPVVMNLEANHYVGETECDETEGCRAADREGGWQ